MMASLNRIAQIDDQGQRLDRWLASWTDLSRSRVQNLLNEGAVQCNGDIITQGSCKVQAGMEYSLTVPPLIDDTPQPENIPLDIAYEDEDLLVVNKPAGMTVHPAPGSPSGTLVNALLYHARESLSGIGGVMRPGIVHRIDKDTSGLLVVAKHDKAHQRLSKQFARHTVDRQYICFVRGYPKPREGRIESRLARSVHDRKKQAIVRGTLGNIEASETGRHAITNYKFLKGFGQNPKAALGTPLFSKISCRLETGRTHQIRVHLAHIGCPLLGDPLYGKQRAFKSSNSPAEQALRQALSDFRRQALHAQNLGFVHPMSKIALNFSSELPNDMLKLESCLSAI